MLPLSTKPPDIVHVEDIEKCRPLFTGIDLVKQIMLDVSGVCEC